MAAILQNVLGKFTQKKREKNFQSLFKMHSTYIMGKMLNLLGDLKIVEQKCDEGTFKITLTYNQTPSFSKAIIYWTVDFINHVIKAKVFFRLNEHCTKAKTKAINKFLFNYFLDLNFKLNDHYAFLIDSENGFLSIKVKSSSSSQFYCFIGYFFRQIEKAQKNISESYYLIANIINEIPPNLLSLVKQKSQTKFFTQDLEAEEKATNQISKYLANCHFHFPIQKKNDDSEENLNPQKKKRRSNKFKGKDVKTYFIFDHLCLKEEKQMNSGQYKKLVESYLTLPPTNKNPSERPFIFNQIEALNKDFRICDIGLENERNKILLTNIKFKYSHQNIAPLIHTFAKNMAIKIAKTNDPSHTLKIEHERAIVSLLEKDESMFLPKYYKCKSSNFQFKNSVLMEFLHPIQPLSKFILSSGKQFSFSTLLFTMINIMEALRFIAKHNIVHMDLSMKNILIYKNLMIKLIDFGESYHKDVLTSRKIQHGFTLPYTFPQRFSHHQYSSKSDIYSFGVMLYKMIFQQSPFGLMDNKLLLKHLEEGTYEGNIRMIPESLSYTGYEKSMMLFLKYLLLCFSKDMNKRPDPCWSIVILKKIYFALKNQPLNK